MYVPWTGGQSIVSCQPFLGATASPSIYEPDVGGKLRHNSSVHYRRGGGLNLRSSLPFPKSARVKSARGSRANAISLLCNTDVYRNIGGIVAVREVYRTEVQWPQYLRQQQKF